MIDYLFDGTIRQKIRIMNFGVVTNGSVLDDNIIKSFINYLIIFIQNMEVY